MKPSEAKNDVICMVPYFKLAIEVSLLILFLFDTQHKRSKKFHTPANFIQIISYPCWFPSALVLVKLNDCSLKQSGFTTDPMDSAQTPISLGMSHQHQPHQTTPRTISNPQPQRYQPSRSWSQDKNNAGWEYADIQSFVSHNGPLQS